MAVGAELWDLLSTATHAVHAPPRGRASPSRCQLAVPYMNPSYAWGAEAPTWRQPGRVRPVLVHFRGRVMNRVRAALVRYYGGLAGNVIEAAHPNTAARCNLNKCSAKAKAKFNFPSQAVHLEEMRRSIFWCGAEQDCTRKALSSKSSTLLGSYEWHTLDRPASAVWSQWGILRPHLASVRPRPLSLSLSLALSPSPSLSRPLSLSPQIRLPASACSLDPSLHLLVGPHILPSSSDRALDPNPGP